MAPFAGIQAIGRCATCEHAFCRTHQAWSGQTPYVDRCAPCLATKQTEAVRCWKEAQVPYVYFESGAARTALLASHVPPVDIYNIRRKWKTGLFGDREVVVATPVGHGWILGTFKWASPGVPDGYWTDVVISEDHLTALLDLSVDDPRYSEYSYSAHMRTCGLVPVRPYSRGYEAWKGVFKGNLTTEDLDGWREVMQAVKRLTGESS